MHGNTPIRTLYGLRMHLRVWHGTTIQKLQRQLARDLRRAQGVAPTFPPFRKLP